MAWTWCWCWCRCSVVQDDKGLICEALVVWTLRCHVIHLHLHFHSHSHLHCRILLTHHSAIHNYKYLIGTGCISHFDHKYWISLRRAMISMQEKPYISLQARFWFFFSARQLPLCRPAVMPFINSFFFFFVDWEGNETNRVKKLLRGGTNFGLR